MVKKIDLIDTIFGKIIISDAFGRKNKLTKDEIKQIKALELLAKNKGLKL